MFYVTQKQNSNWCDESMGHQRNQINTSKILSQEDNGYCSVEHSRLTLCEYNAWQYTVEYHTTISSKRIVKSTWKTKERLDVFRRHPASYIPLPSHAKDFRYSKGIFLTTLLIDRSCIKWLSYFYVPEIFLVLKIFTNDNEFTKWKNEVQWRDGWKNTRQTSLMRNNKVCSTLRKVFM